MNAIRKSAVGHSVNAISMASSECAGDAWCFVTSFEVQVPDESVYACHRFIKHVLFGVLPSLPPQSVCFH